MFEHIDCRGLWKFKSKLLINLSIYRNHILVTKTGSCLEFDPTEAVKKYQASVENTLTKGLQSAACYTAAQRS